VVVVFVVFSKVLGVVLGILRLRLLRGWLLSGVLGSSSLRGNLLDLPFGIEANPCLPLPLLLSLSEDLTSSDDLFRPLFSDSGSSSPFSNLSNISWACFLASSEALSLLRVAL